MKNAKFSYAILGILCCAWPPADALGQTDERPNGGRERTRFERLLPVASVEHSFGFVQNGPSDSHSYAWGDTRSPTQLSLRRAHSPPEQTDHAPAHDATDNRSASYPPPFGFSLTESWFDPWPHSHFSRRGTPFVHLFLTEPAFLDRDLFLDYRLVRTNGEDEMELEFELEWALTRRLGLVIEVPYLFLRPIDEPDEHGFGDVAFAPRALLVDTERFMLSVNLEIETPTGSERRGLSEGEVALAPSFSWWYDLGHWITWQAQIGTEHGLTSGDAELVWNSALTYSLLGPALVEPPSRDSTHGGRHFPPGLTNFIVEITGRTRLSGEGDVRSTAEILFGTSYLISSEFEIRAGVQVPLFQPHEMDYGFVFGLIYHF